MTLKCIALLLFAASAQAFLSVSPSKPVSCLQAQGGFLYTGGSAGSSLVSHGRVDIDAPWGTNNPNLHKSKPYQRRAQHHGRPVDRPGTTGGTNGSTFVSDIIEKDSLYGSNYYRAQGCYRSSRPRSMSNNAAAQPSQALPPQETVRTPTQASPAVEQVAKREFQPSN